jgi:NADH dehydrogenase
LWQVLLVFTKLIGMKINVPELGKPRIVIIGGGFGGIELAKAMRRNDVQIVLLDKHNYHTFQPLLYQVATAGLEPDSIAFPLRKIFKRQSNLTFRMTNVENIDTQTQTIYTNIGTLHYDYLVLATGSTTNYFGIKSIAENGMPMKNVPEALNLRSLILQNLEAALETDDLNEREALMSFAIVGGGPTGVEMAGALGELKKHVLPADYPDLDLRQMKIHLIESGAELLGAMSPISSQKALAFLKKFDVNVWLNTAVTDYDGDTVVFKDGRTLPACVLIWSAGVMGNMVQGIPAEAIARGQRIVTDEYSRVKGYTNLFAIGDVAAMISEQNPRGYPMVAPVAMQQGQLLAKNLMAIINGKEPKPFKYFDKGVMATIGRNRAVVESMGFKTQGFMAWFMWMTVHLLTLVGFRNKVVTLINWTWSYFNYDRGIRLIIRPYKNEPNEL